MLEADAGRRRQVRAVIEAPKAALERESGQAPAAGDCACSISESELMSLLERVAARPFEYSVKRIAAELHVSAKTVLRRFVGEGLGTPANWITAHRTMAVWAEVLRGERTSASIARRLGVRDVRPVRRIVQLIGARTLRSTFEARVALLSVD